MIKSLPVLHPFMLVSLFVLTCYREVQPFVKWEELLGLWFLALLGTYGLFRLFKLFIQRPFAASILTTLVVVGLCFYGDMDGRLRGWLNLISPWLGRARVTAIIVVSLLGATAWWVFRTRRDLAPFKKLLNVVITVMVLVTVVREQLYPVQFVSRRDRPREVDEHGPFPRVENRPDIYYIILDSYTGGGSLKQFWGFDNTPFLSALESKGFLVVSNARGNYDRTHRCMASSLNMALLKHPPPGLGTFGQVNRACELVDLATAPRKLQDIGYEIVNKSLFDLAGHPQRYTYPFVDYCTLAEVILQKSFVGFIEAWWRKRNMERINLEILSELETLAAARASHPRFIYAHLMMPHAPMVFDRHGRRAHPTYTPQGTAAEYLEQLLYVNHRVTNLVEKILLNSKAPPIIILQGDHGFRWLPERDSREESTSILNAYLIPGARPEWIYPGITPVNTFRMLFNHQFGAHYEYSPDRWFLTRDTLSTEPEKK